MVAFKYLSILSLTCGLVLAQSEQALAGSCFYRRSDIQKIMSDIEKNPPSIFIEASSLSSQMRSCNYNFSEFGKDLDYISKQKKIAAPAAYEKEKEALREAISKDPKNVSGIDSDLDRLKEIAEAGGFYDSKTIADLSALKAYHTRSVEKVLAKIDLDFKNSCQKKPVNLSKKMPPVRDQDSIGWCYAFAAADLLSFKLGVPISAFDVALGYESDIFKSRYTGAPEGTGKGGYIYSALLSADEAGYCKEADMRSSSDLKHFDLGFSMAMFDAAYKSKNELKKNSCAFQKVFADRGIKISAQDFEQALSKDNYGDTLVELRKRACANRIKPIKNLDAKTIRYPNVNFDSKIEIQKDLLSGKPVGIELTMNSILKTESEKELNHAMIVVGQKQNENNECVFVIRNSWGKSCASFDTTKVKCDADGMLEVAPAELDRMLIGTVTLK